MYMGWFFGSLDGMVADVKDGGSVGAQSPGCQILPWLRAGLAVNRRFIPLITSCPSSGKHQTFAPFVTIITYGAEEGSHKSPV